ncbi:hypothetical protein DdX_01362 [Ditylenchus destructor]|uniref:Uncharacterized protein n=1 Tax=Ditylenchus destructor TaxID=166010 RepID=A0AAD4RDU4_9BILA|nr:hypothetical protein DdX_01362 [Ditylenchus destructor]
MLLLEAVHNLESVMSVYSSLKSSNYESTHVFTAIILVLHSTVVITHRYSRLKGHKTIIPFKKGWCIESGVNRRHWDGIPHRVPEHEGHGGVNALSKLKWARSNKQGITFHALCLVSRIAWKGN